MARVGKSPEKIDAAMTARRMRLSARAHIRS